uniref:Manganese-dependent ADP-ribose/CDP-alcohol diphosphatase gene2 n=1 Tax=Xenopus tropicalis TaxID=8364 RepID=A0A6I8S2T2_XENTR
MEASAMTKCIVKGCSNTTQKNSGVTLHGFPNSLSAIKLWLEQTGNDFGDLDAFAKRVLDSRSRWIYRMCSKHFSPQSYIWSGKKLILRPDAVPTIFPGKMNRYIMEDVLGFTRSESAQVEMQLQLDSITQQHGGHHPTALCKCQTSEAPKTSKTEHRHKEEVKQAPTPATGKVMVDKSTNTDPMVGKADKGTLWPEFEYNFDGEPWKIKHDHFYPHVRLAKDPKKRGRPSKHRDSFWCTNDYESIKNSLNHKHRYPLTDSPYIFIERDYFDADMVPITSGDMAVFFSREEWKYIEEHKEDYQDMLPDEPPFSKFRLPQGWGPDNPKDEPAATEVSFPTPASPEDSKERMLITEDGLYTSLHYDAAPTSPPEHIKEEIEEIHISDKGFPEPKSECTDYPADEVKEEMEECSITDRDLGQNLDYSSGHCLSLMEDKDHSETMGNKQPYFTFGVIADVQYADRPTAPNCWGSLRYYRDSLTHFHHAVAEWSSQATVPNFVLQLGDIIDSSNKRLQESENALEKVLQVTEGMKGRWHHVWGNHELYNFKRSYLVQSKLNTRPMEDPIPDIERGEAADYYAYHFSPYPRFRFVVIDTYDLSSLGRDMNHPNYQASIAFVTQSCSPEEPGDSKGWYRVAPPFRSGLAVMSLAGRAMM